MTEPINMDGFMDAVDMFKAIADVEGTGSRLYRQYARYKAYAMRARQEGAISNALHWEECCERIYNRIPERLKW